MAFFETPTPSAPLFKTLKDAARHFRDALETPFTRRQRLIQRRIAVFRDLTDAELETIGLKRDQIVPHVLRTTTPTAHVTRP